MPDELAALRVRLHGEVDRDRMSTLVVGAGSWIRSLEVSGDRGNVSIVVCTDTDFLPNVRGVLQAALVGASLETTDPPKAPAQCVGWEARTGLTDVVPLVPRAADEFDFLPTLLGLLHKEEDASGLFQIVVSAEADLAWRRRALVRAQRLRHRPPTMAQRVLSFAVPRASDIGPDPLRHGRSLEQAAREKASTDAVVCATIRFVAGAITAESARRLAQQAWHLLQNSFADDGNFLQLAPIRDRDAFMSGITQRRHGRVVMLNQQELGALWHLDLGNQVGLDGVVTTSIVRESPRQVRSGEVPIGRDASGRQVFSRRADLRMHTLLVGATGVGKSTFMARRFLEDVSGDQGGLFIEPKGDTVDRLLGTLPAHREADVICFDLGEPGRVNLNPVAFADVADLAAAICQLHPDSTGMRRARVLHNALAAIKAVPGLGFIDLYHFLTGAHFRASVLTHVRDPFCLAFWQEEFEAQSRSVRLQWIEPAVHLLQPFLSHEVIRSVLAAGPGLNPRQLMDDGKVVLLNLAQGQIGPENAYVLAHLILSCVKRAALSRTDMPESRRRDFHLYVDEAQATAPAHLIKVLSECRAVRLNATLSTQFLHQLPRDVVEALLGNVGSTVAFRLGESDAHLLAGRFAPEFRPADLLALPNYRAVARLLAHGEVLRPFSLFTEPLQSIRDEDRAYRLRTSPLNQEFVQLEFGPDSEVAAPPEVEWQPDQSAHGKQGQQAEVSASGIEGSRAR